MEKQIIISVGREFGSGGHEIAEHLAKRLSLPFYDRNLLDEIANEKEVSGSALLPFDEVPRNRLLSRTVRGYNNSPEEVVARLQFNFLKNKAANGESFVVVGRCSEDILKGYDALVSFFIIADMETKLERVRQLRGISKEEAEAVIRRHDKKRRSYHNYYCQTKWGDARNYDMTVNCSKLSRKAATDLLEYFIEARQREKNKK